MGFVVSTAARNVQQRHGGVACRVRQQPHNRLRDFLGAAAALGSNQQCELRRQIVTFVTVDGCEKRSQLRERVVQDIRVTVAGSDEPLEGI